MTTNIKTIISYIFITFAVPVVTMIAMMLSSADMNEESMLVAANVITDIILILVMIRLQKNEFIRSIKELQNTRTSEIVKTLMSRVFAMYAVSYTSSLILFFTGLMKEPENQQAIYDMALSSLPATGFMVIIGAPIIEETVFRCSMISNHKKKKGIAAFLISSLLFGMLHSQFHNLWEILPYFLIGIILGQTYLKHRNVIINILIHGFYNISAFAMMVTAIKLS